MNLDLYYGQQYFHAWIIVVYSIIIVWHYITILNDTVLNYPIKILYVCVYQEEQTTILFWWIYDLMAWMVQE